jgi:hypothetical protein
VGRLEKQEQNSKTAKFFKSAADARLLCPKNEIFPAFSEKSRRDRDPDG